MKAKCSWLHRRRAGRGSRGHDRRRSLLRASTKVNVDRTFHFAAGDLCSFPVTLHNKGVRRTTTYFDSSGNVTRTAIHLAAFTQTATNDLTGASQSTPLAGPPITEPNGDGTVTTRIPGNDGIIVVPARASSTAMSA